MIPSLWEIALILIFIFLLFGHKTIPNMMTNLAKGMKTFKKEVNNIKTAGKSPVKKKGGTKKNTGAKSRTKK
ncbi:MAG: twin-arginine translocase TatA/TatE family subunit [Alphaproteobacteria bacterium]|nr:twin-arginine translocase TatA/TatE family subunit [Alphaproteobacteria bacterium]